MGRIINNEKFFCDVLDLSIPEFKELPELVGSGRIGEAEHIFAEYVRNTVKPDLYFKIPYYSRRENMWTYDAETDEDAAERILRHELISCGFPHQFPEHIDWTANPTYNDYKEWTWQLNRHHEWRLLGKRYRDTGEQRFARCFTDLLMSWIEHATVSENVADGDVLCWRTIEAGIRMTKNWHYAFHACYKSPYFTDHVMTQYFQSIWEHAYILKNYHKTGNWLIMEMAGLVHIGILYPFFKEANLWKDYAFDKLCREIDAQIYPDHFQYELTTNYHQVLIDNYNYVTDIACAMGDAPPKKLSDGLEKMYSLYPQIVAPDGTIPDLNDGSNQHIGEWMSSAVKLFPHRKDFLWLCTNGAQGTSPSYHSFVMPYSGMAVFRTGWGKDDIWALFEDAPFGKAHQHEDKLSFLLYAYGKHLLKDTGNYDYDTSEMRKYVLSTRSHNTARVDGLDQNRRGGYVWHSEDIQKFAGIKYRSGEGYEIAQGEYDEGYGEEHIKVNHRRKAILIKNVAEPFFIIADTFLPQDCAAHSYEIMWHLEDVAYDADGHRVTADYGDGVILEMIGSDTPCIVKGQKEPEYQGWKPVKAPGEHEHQPVPTVLFQTSGIGYYTQYITVLHPYKGNSGCKISIEGRTVILSDKNGKTAIDTEKYTV